MTRNNDSSCATWLSYSHVLSCRATVTASSISSYPSIQWDWGSRSYLQLGGHTAQLAPQNQSLHPRVLRLRGRGSPRSSASSSPPAWGSYPWGSEESWEGLRSAGLEEASRSWLQPSSRGWGWSGVQGGWGRTGLQTVYNRLPLTGVGGWDHQSSSVSTAVTAAEWLSSPLSHALLLFSRRLSFPLVFQRRRVENPLVLFQKRRLR